MKIKHIMAVVLSLWCSASFAQSHSTQVLKVAQTEWPPFIMDSAYGQGIAYDFIIEGLVKAGYQVEFAEKPWGRILKETFYGKNDVIVAMWKNEQREKHFLFTEPYMYNQMAVLSRRNSDFEFTDIDSLKGKEIALIDRYAYTAKLLDYPHFIPVNSIDLPNSVRLVMTKRADVLVSDEIVARWTLKEMELDPSQFRFSTIYLDSSPLHVGVRRDHPLAQEIVSSLNHYFNTHGESRLAELKTKYGISN